jgi:O-antigen/teichoic acid export membrane protein
LNIRQKAIRGVAWLIAQKSGNQVVSLLVITILTRLLDVDSFGLIAMATVYIALIDLFLDQGFGQAIIQRAEVSKTHLDTAFWMTIVIGTLLSSASLAASGFVANLFHEPILNPIVRWLSLSLVFSTFSKTPRAILQRELEFGKLAVRTFVAEIVGGVVGVFLAFKGFGVWSLVGRNLSRDFVAMLILWGVSDWRPGLRFSYTRLRELYSFGVNIIGSQFLTYVSRFADRFLIGILLDATVLGFYTMGARVIELMSALLLQSIEIVSLPFLSRLQNELDRMRHAFYQLTCYASILAIPCFLGILITAPEIVLTLFGSKWIESIPILRILALTGIAQTVHLLGWSLLIASGKPSWHLVLTVLSTSGNLLAIILAAQWGIVAIAAGIVISSFALIPFTLWAIRRAVKIELHEYVRQFHPAFVGALGMSVPVLILQSILRGSISNPVGLLIYIICASLIYGLILWRFHPKYIERIYGFILLLAEGQFIPISSSSN